MIRHCVISELIDIVPLNSLIHRPIHGCHELDRHRSKWLSSKNTRDDENNSTLNDVKCKTVITSMRFLRIPPEIYDVVEELQNHTKTIEIARLTVEQFQNCVSRKSSIRRMSKCWVIAIKYSGLISSLTFPTIAIWILSCKVTIFFPWLLWFVTVYLSHTFVEVGVMC